jgi:hypothetical protein
MLCKKMIFCTTVNQTKSGKAFNQLLRGGRARFVWKVRFSAQKALSIFQRATAGNRNVHKWTDDTQFSFSDGDLNPADL